MREKRKVDLLSKSAFSIKVLGLNKETPNLKLIYLSVASFFRTEAEHILLH